MVLEGFTVQGLLSLSGILLITAFSLGQITAERKAARYKEACEQVVAAYHGDDNPVTNTLTETMYQIARDALFPDFARLSRKSKRTYRDR